jgi:hypothetical protein
MKKRINLTAHRLRDLENRSIHHKDSLSPYNPMLIIDSDKGNNGETARETAQERGNRCRAKTVN